VAGRLFADLARAACVGLGVLMLAIFSGLPDVVWPTLESVFDMGTDELQCILSSQGCMKYFLTMVAARDSLGSLELASTSEPAYAVNQDGIIVAWNRAAERAFGYPASKAIGQRCWDLLAGNDVFDNRYCCSGCPLREMAFCHEPIRGSTLSLKTSSQERNRFLVHMLLVRDSNDQEMLVHLCQPAREAADARLAVIPTRVAPASRGDSVLTGREIEVLARLADGMETSEIASDLYISHATVRNHIQRILNKLRVHSRIAAVARGRRRGLI
jgi:DNA-binding CsgD family transcriptional regulator